MPIKHIEGAISRAKCLICPTLDTAITLKCSHDDCHQEIVFNTYYSDPPKLCPSCEACIEDYVDEGLDTGEFVTSDNICDHIDINCPNCCGYHTVVEHFHHYICT
jgi:hypothetical protein